MDQRNTEKIGELMCEPPFYFPILLIGLINSRPCFLCLRKRERDVRVDCVSLKILKNHSEEKGDIA
jgi:hypothetical protein